MFVFSVGFGNPTEASVVFCGVLWCSVVYCALSSYRKVENLSNAFFDQYKKGLTQLVFWAKMGSENFGV